MRFGTLNWDFYCCVVCILGLKAIFKQEFQKCLLLKENAWIFQVCMHIFYFVFLNDKISEFIVRVLIASNRLREYSWLVRLRYSPYNCL